MEAAVLPRVHLRASLVLVLEEAPVHGYDLPGLLAPLGMGETDRGFVYRTLRALVSEGLMASVWDTSPSGPDRRTYTVTPAGTQWAALATATLQEADRHMARWLARYRALVRSGGPEGLPVVSAAS